MPQRPHRSAFSLIELLIVVAVIAILSSLLFTAIGSVRTLARRTVCASNLRQIGMGLLSFASDHHGLFPGYCYASDGGYPYVFGDWGTHAWWYSDTDFYRDYMPVQREVFYCPEGRLWQRGSGTEFEKGFETFPAKPPSAWILSIGYCYYGGPDESGINRRNGPRGLGFGTADSTLIADLMRFANGPDATMTQQGHWNHLAGPWTGANTRINAKTGGNMCYKDGRVEWKMGPTELARHVQVLYGGKVWCAEQPGDP